MTQTIGDRLCEQRNDPIEVSLNYMLVTFAGLPYLWGGDNPVIETQIKSINGQRVIVQRGGVDCSGLDVEYLKTVFPVWARDKKDMVAQGLYWEFPRTTRPKRGGLVFFGNDINHITHTGILYNDWQFLGANGGGRNVRTIADAVKYDAYVNLRPLRYRSDVVGYNYPFLHNDWIKEGLSHV